MISVEMRTSQDVVTFLIEQHQQIRQLFAKVEAAHSQEREQAFLDLRRMLAIHETAEEEVVHPRARRELVGGEYVVDASLAEEHAAKELIATLEGVQDVDTLEFDEQLSSLKAAVIAHAEHEERQEFSQLAVELDAEQLRRMGQAARLIEQFAPTRPHPGLESGAANMLVGPFASMLDRTRDFLTRP
jgi:hemerythrin superfamily protein